MPLSHRGRAHTPALAAVLALVLALGLSLVRPQELASARVKEQALVELDGIVKGLARVERLDPGSKRFREKTAEMEEEKRRFIAVHLQSERVFKLPFQDVFGSLEHADLLLSSARRSSMNGNDKDAGRKAEIALNPLEALSADLFAANPGGEAQQAISRLGIIIADLNAVSKGAERDEDLKGKELRGRIGRVESKKLLWIKEELGAETVCGLRFDLVYDLLKCADLQLALARDASKRGNEKAARSHVRRAAACLGALRANLARAAGG